MKADTGTSRQAALVPLYGMVDKKLRPLDEDLIIVGRARGCDIVLDAPEVSSLHCVVYHWGSGFRMRDCGSRTGTRVNGDARKSAALHDGDILQIGPFSFNVSLPDHPQGLGPVLGLKEQLHLQRSRRRLAELALRSRRRLHQFIQANPESLTAELRQKASGLRVRIRTFDQRLVDLENAERELAADREALDKAREAHAAHVQQVEADLAERLQAADAEVHQRWTDFQQRCQLEERRLAHRQAGASGPPSQADQPETPSLAEENLRLAEARVALAKDHEELRTMQEQWHHQQAAAEATQRQQQNAIAQAEAGLKEQRQQLQTMIGQLRALQESIRKETKGEVGLLTRDQDQLKKQLAEAQAQAKAARRQAELDQARAHHAKRLEEENAELRRLLEELSQQSTGEGADPDLARQCEELRKDNEQLRRILAALEEPGGERKTGDSADAEELRQENELLRQLLHEKDALFDEMKQKVVNASTHKQARGASDLETYEAELNQYRQQLEADRAKFSKEIEQLRVRNQELDEATREMELEMSRERAEMARERQRLDRLRDEIRSEQERMTRDSGVNKSLAPVQKLREEMNQKKGIVPAKNQNDPMRTLRQR